MTFQVTCNKDMHAAWPCSLHHNQKS